MTTYKNFYGTREEYIEFLKERLAFWSKAFAGETNTELRAEWIIPLEEVAQHLADEGIDWSEIEKIENNAMK